MSFLVSIEEPPPTPFKTAVCFSVLDTSGARHLAVSQQTMLANRVRCRSVVAAIHTWVSQDLKPFYVDVAHAREQTSFEDVDAILVDYVPSSPMMNAIAELEKPLSVARPGFLDKHGEGGVSTEAQEIWTHSVLLNAELVIVNHQECSLLLDRTVESASQLRDAAKGLFDLGAKTVLVTGGHLDGIVRDYCYDGSGIYEFGADQIRVKNLHGTGEAHAAYAASRRAHGDDVLSSIEAARAFVTQAIENAQQGPCGCHRETAVLVDTTATP